MLVLHTVHDLPIVWDDATERARLAAPNEKPDDDDVIGYAEILDVDLYGERRLFLRTYYDDPDDE